MFEFKVTECEFCSRREFRIDRYQVEERKAHTQFLVESICARTFGCRDAMHTTHICNELFSDVGTRGGSLASSRGYLEIAGNGQMLQQTTQNQHAHQTSPLCSKYTDQSLLSFCSNVSAFAYATIGAASPIILM